MVRVGLDAHGRATIAETVADERVHRSDVITWSGDQAELLALREGALEDLRVTTFADGRPAWTISTMGDAKLDGRPSVEVTDHRRPELEVRVYESNAHRSWGLERGPYWGWIATRRTYGDDGRLMLVEYIAPTEHGIADGQGVEAAFAAATEAYERGAYTSSVGWDGRVLALEEPPQDRMTVLEGLAPALADAIHAAVGPHPAPLAFVWVELRLIGGSEHPVIPRALAVDVAYRDRAREHAGRPRRDPRRRIRRPPGAVARPCVARTAAPPAAGAAELRRRAAGPARPAAGAGAGRRARRARLGRRRRRVRAAGAGARPRSRPADEHRARGRARPRAARVAARRAKPARRDADADRPRAAAGAAHRVRPARRGGGPRRRGRRVGHPARPGFRREPDRRPAGPGRRVAADRRRPPAHPPRDARAGRVARRRGPRGASRFAGT